MQQVLNNMHVVNKEVMYALLHVDSQQVFAGLIFNNIIWHAFCVGLT